MALVDSKLKRQEEQRDVDGLVLSNFDYLELTGVGIWN